MIALAGNKADLANNRVVEYDEAKQYAEENGLLFMETSAKTALNVNDIFLAIGEWSLGKSKVNSEFTLCVLFAAKKLPKSEGGPNQGVQGRRLEPNEQNKQSNNCCK